MLLFQVRTEGLKQSKNITFIQASGRAMPDGFAEYNLRNNGKHMGIIVFMSNSPESRMDLLTREETPGLSFAGNEAKFNKNGKIAMQVAAAFHGMDGRIEGMLIEKGVAQNRLLSKDSGSALVVIDGNGKPTIHNIRDSIFSNSLEIVKFFDEAEKNKWSVFQQFLVIGNGKPADIGKFEFKSSPFYCLRFLVEMQNMDGSSSYGIISFEKNVSLEDAMKIMLNLTQGAGGKPARMKNAVYLDSGSVGKGFVHYENGTRRLTGEGDFDDSHFSNMLILHSQPEKNNKFFTK
ncbi:MAG: hypothetical protein NT051_02735 [Candidatus Micrarchaeota archaeon]|nr:hypothetical protein [Candidatus Micrarchaeota archaeon]